ncbi:MAG: flagellar hook capping FlgD N-terminal domain-containing protein, partial [Eubacteriales bacterium]|nr:flagellar hook capping FlgD N-terminal domain-containing protein [Eubacteriales bacterium]
MKIEEYQSGGVNAATQRSTGGGNSLSMDDFLALMVAQLSNQDMYNTVDDTQFVTQMAQFS